MVLLAQLILQRQSEQGDMSHLNRLAVCVCCYRRTDTVDAGIIKRQWIIDMGKPMTINHFGRFNLARA